MSRFQAKTIHRVGLSADRKTFEIDFKAGAGQCAVSLPVEQIDTLFLCLTQTDKQLKATKDSQTYSHAIARWDVLAAGDDVVLTFQTAEGYEMSYHIPRNRLQGFLEPILVFAGHLPERSTNLQ